MAPANVNIFLAKLTIRDIIPQYMLRREHPSHVYVVGNNCEYQEGITVITRDLLLKHAGHDIALELTPTQIKSIAQGTIAIEEAHVLWIRLQSHKGQFTES